MHAPHKDAVGSLYLRTNALTFTYNGFIIYDCMVITYCLIIKLTANCFTTDMDIIKQ